MYMYIWYPREKNNHFNIFRPKDSSVKLNFLTRYILLLY